MQLTSCYMKHGYEAGCDEAGRGCLAGPVFGAAVILPPGFDNDVLNDSKKLTLKQRYLLRETIMEQFLAWSVALVDNHEIDRINILKASVLAMHRAIEQLSVTPEHLIIDGNYFIPYKRIPFRTIVKGDAKYQSIAAASILAKTFRDDYMNRIHNEHYQFGWDRNKGYPTRQHRAAIYMFGITKYHRRTFNLLSAVPA